MREIPGIGLVAWTRCSYLKLNMTDRIAYSLDAADRIVRIEGQWDDFAAANRGQHVTRPSVLGTSIFSHIAGSEVRSLYRQIFAKVRETHEPARFPYRCDSPEFRRNMAMTVSPRDRAGLHIESTTRGVTTRAPASILTRGKTGDTARVACICSVCCRVLDADGTWREVEAADVAAACLGSAGSVQLVDRICPECSMVDLGCRYLLTGNDRVSGRPRPLVVFLHGGGHSNYLLRLQAPPRLWHRLQQDDALLVSPLKRTSGAWTTHEVQQIIDHVSQTYAIDSHRIYVTGVSAGAIATWRLLAQQPRRFAAAAPIAGISPGAVRDVSIQTPVWAFYGERDPVMRAQSFRAELERLRRFVPTLRATEYPEAGHEIWGRAYNDATLWSWILSQRAGSTTGRRGGW
ncbi:MAG: hypothetical protein B7733_01175 [Myxococcales bacterium FL481]|nr:MAG: hypothetical protein B7733_01175 [Myxococcales bacterium FL481]